MKISKDAVADLHYTLKNDGGEVVDSSAGGEPLAYLHGHGSIVAGLEKALEGKSAGEKLQVVVPPEGGYGVRDESLIQELALRDFEKPGQVKPGIQFQMHWDGEHRLATVKSVKQGPSSRVVPRGTVPLRPVAKVMVSAVSPLLLAT